jgi:toxin ParE1/3/4
VPRLRYTETAQADLADIGSYIAQKSGSFAIAREFVARLRKHCRKIAASLGTLGVARPDLRSDLRSTPFGNYTIFFRYCPETLEIIAILESHRDSMAHFSRSDAAPLPGD